MPGKKSRSQWSRAMVTLADARLHEDRFRFRRIGVEFSGELRSELPGINLSEFGAQKNAGDPFGVAGIALVGSTGIEPVTPAV